jgi:hypothetical protein
VSNFLIFFSTLLHLIASPAQSGFCFSFEVELPERLRLFRGTSSLGPASRPSCLLFYWRVRSSSFRAIVCRDNGGNARCSSVAASSGESVRRQPPKQSKWPMVVLNGRVLQAAAPPARSSAVPTVKVAVIIPATRCSSVAASSGESVRRQPPKQSKWPMIFLDGLVLQPNFKSTSIFQF